MTPGFPFLVPPPYSFFGYTVSLGAPAAPPVVNAAPAAVALPGPGPDPLPAAADHDSGARRSRLKPTSPEQKAKAGRFIAFGDA